MARENRSLLLIIVTCLGLIVSGCPKKVVVKEQPPLTEVEKFLAEREKAKIEVEQKEFEKSLVAKSTPGIEGQIFESSLLEDVHFDFDRYDIRKEDVEILKRNAALLMKYSNVMTQIEGHCDERGTVEYNLALGERRANTVRMSLISNGVPETRISIISYGKERPLDPAHTEEAWAKNRRAHIVVLSK